MEIPILLGANPKTANPVEWIPVRFDRWFVRVEGLVDSELTLCSNEPSFTDISILNGQVFNGQCLVRVRFDKRGTEKAITVFVVEEKEHHDKIN
ncbi:hypothetical protein LCGC14_2615160 [marine sediment metagenome]|uniref:Uncharacterized protein n=1 Tax=marine sediment metagenome TaxID=412755 RepID=A0A0F9ASD1_9ZZZZ